MKTDKIYNILDYVIPAYLVVALVEYLLNNWSLEFPVKLLAMGFTLLFLFIKGNHKSSPAKTVLTIFLIYNLLSIFSYFGGGNGREIECYLSDLYNYIAAMLFFYVGFYDPRKENTFYNQFLVFCFGAMVIGLFFYVFLPYFHLARHSAIMSSQWFSDTTYSDDSIMNMMRFSGIIGTDYGVGNFCMFGLAIALNYYSRGIKIKKLPMSLVVLILIIAGFMTQLRIVIVSASAATLYYLFSGIKTGTTKNSLKIILIALVLGVIAVTVLNKYFSERVSAFKDIIEFTTGRMDFNSAYDERSGQVEAALKIWDDKVFGQGMGSANSIASKNGHQAILDQCYAKMLVELGYVGISIFIIFILMTLFKGVSHFKNNLIELVIVVFVLCSMIGADTLYFHYFQIIPFWYAAGRIWNPFVRGKRKYAQLPN